MTRRRLLLIAAVILLLLVLIISVRRIAYPEAGLRQHTATLFDLEHPSSADEKAFPGGTVTKTRTRVSRMSTPEATERHPPTADIAQRRFGSGALRADGDSSSSAAAARRTKDEQRFLGYIPDHGTPEGEQEPNSRAKVSRARNSMRSMATAIESYFVDNNSYPASTTDTAVIPLHAYALDGYTVPSFLSHYPDGPAMLTTPIAYATSYFPDPFASVPGETFAYFQKEDGWITFSPGPDGKFDLLWDLYTTRIAQPSLELILFAYDPTNGSISGGDVFRVKQ
jgi:hypothetical protein